MKKFRSSLHVSSYYNDDIWGRIFRFNKCVKAFKYISFSSSVFIKRKFQRKFHINSDYYFKKVKPLSRFGFSNKVNSFGRRLSERHRLQYFYGKLTKKSFINFLRKSKGKTSYSRVDYLFSRFEFRIDLCLFRAGWFTGTLAPFYSVYHGFASLDGRVSPSPFEIVDSFQFITLSKFVFQRREVLRRVCSSSFVFPVKYLFVSEYFPAMLVFDKFDVSCVKIRPNTDRFRILRYAY